MSKKGGLGKVLFGVALGAGLGLMFAPQTGSETRKQLKRKMDELLSCAKEIDPYEVKDVILDKIDELKHELADLDKEKVLKIAKKQSASIQAKAEELYKYAVKKGTPILEKAADEVRLQAIKVATEVIERLESKETIVKPLKKVTTKK